MPGGRLVWRHAELVEEEGEDIGLLGDFFAEAGAHAVAGGGAEADDDRVIRGGGGLEAGGHATGVGGVDAAIGFAGEEEDGWVGGAVFDVVEG